MRIVYFDCFAGISGDMTLGALIAAGASADVLRERLALLPLTGYDLNIGTTLKKGISAIDVTVSVHEHQHARHLPDIVGIISSSRLSDEVKGKSIGVFEKLAEAEAKVHGCSVDHVHFHEVGAVDAIVDIVGTAICLEILDVERVCASPLPVPHGFVESAHGRFPLPAPATVELTRGIPTYGVDVEGELVTPTGAAILAALASEFGPAPAMRVDATGYGAGKSDHGFPNVLRVMTGYSDEASGMTSEPLVVLETNMDDMNPQMYDSVMERLFSEGARDVFLSPIQMKKNRPATLLSILCDPDKISAMLSIVFRETSTLGVRIQHVQRACLERTWETVDTVYGAIRMKIGSLSGEMMNVAPEYEDCRTAAAAHGAPVKEVHDAAIAVYRTRSLGSDRSD